MADERAQNTLRRFCLFSSKIKLDDLIRLVLLEPIWWCSLGHPPSARQDREASGLAQLRAGSRGFPSQTHERVAKIFIGLCAAQKGFRAKRTDQSDSWRDSRHHQNECERFEQNRDGAVGYNGQFFLYPVFVGHVETGAVRAFER